MVMEQELACKKFMSAECSAEVSFMLSALERRLSCVVADESIPGCTVMERCSYQENQDSLLPCCHASFGLPKHSFWLAKGICLVKPFSRSKGRQTGTSRSATSILNSLRRHGPLLGTNEVPLRTHSYHPGRED